MSLIRISVYNYCDVTRINACEIYQKEDNCWYVKWFTEDGEFLSDAFTGKIAAANYINEINEKIIEYEKTGD